MSINTVTREILAITDPKRLEELSTSGLLPERWAVADNPNTPLSALTKLSEDGDSCVRCSVADNKSTPPELLEKMARDENFGVRYCVTQNPNATAAILMMLSGDIDSHVRWGVASSPNATPQAMQVLADDKDLDIRLSVACNPNTSRWIVQKLASEQSEKMRMCIKEVMDQMIQAMEKGGESAPAAAPLACDPYDKFRNEQTTASGSALVRSLPNSFVIYLTNNIETARENWDWYAVTPCRMQIYDEAKTPATLIATKTFSSIAAVEAFLGTQAAQDAFYILGHRELSLDDMEYALDPERGEYRGFAALHDRHDANMFLPRADDPSLAIDEAFIERSNAAMDAFNTMVLGDSEKIASAIKN